MRPARPPVAPPVAQPVGAPWLTRSWTGATWLLRSRASALAGAGPGLVLLTLALLLSAVTHAQTPTLAGLDLRVTDADLAPQVTLRTFENRTVEAFSVNNNTYMIRITPTVGAPYYLIDQDGSGDLNWNRGQPGLETQVPQWALMRW